MPKLIWFYLIKKFQGSNAKATALDTQAAPPPLEHRQSGGLGLKPASLSWIVSSAIALELVRFKLDRLQAR